MEKVNAFRNAVCVCVLVLSVGRTGLGARAPATEGEPNAIPVVINEFLASNSGRFQVDPQGESDDWIELYNFGAQPLDVGGMYLTDDLALPTKWQIPSDKPDLTTISPLGYLVIWADKDVEDAGLHAGFALSADGEDVALFGKDGVTLIDGVAFGPQMADVSYGRFPDGNDTWCFMTLPTPGARNVRIREGIVAEPKFSFEHGFYDRELSVAIACKTPEATIYYTTDGSEPYVGDIGRSTTAAVCQEPVRITKTTCLRAVAIKAGWQPSRVVTRTYIFLADVVKQSPSGAAPGRGWPTGGVNGQTIDYGMDPDVVNGTAYKGLMKEALLAIPSISFVTDLANLFDPEKGIYVNAGRYGDIWERPISMELIYPDEREGFQIDAGLRVRGGYSRSDSNPKHAFRLFFRSEYGAARLKYPLFDDEGVQEFENLDLRTSQNYSWAFDGDKRNTLLRDVFSRDTQRDMGQPYTRSRYYHLYINGQYWGLYQTEERPEASYGESYFGGSKDDYDVIKAAGPNAGFTVEATDGQMAAYRALWEAATGGFNTDESYYRVQGLNLDGSPNPEYPKLLDLDNLIDYMLCTFYAGDFDGPISNFLGNTRPNNFYAIYNHVTPDGFKWFRHDAEHTLIDRYGWGLDRTGPYTDPDLARLSYFTPQWLQQRLLVHPEFRMRLADRAYRYFFNNRALTYARSKDRMLSRARQIEMAIIAESARWGDAKRSAPFTKVDWETEVNRIINDYGDYGLPNRTQVVLNQLKAHGWYPSIGAPVFSPHGGHVTDGFPLEMRAADDIYYTLDGTDPRLPERAGGATGATVLVAANAPKRVLVPTEDIGDGWRGGGSFDDSAWQLVTGDPGGVGYERSTGYETMISLDLSQEMYTAATGCYIRIPFNVIGDPNRYGSMTLRVRYDDGFVAYLNGVEVQRASFDGTPKWNSAAQANHEADAIESFIIGDRVSLLHAGQNVLAIHGLNSSTASSDFLVLVSLSAAEGATTQSGGISPTAIKYTGPVTLNDSVQVKARTLSGTTWSALNEAVFALGSVAERLRISEIMYHPLSTGDPNDPNTEFIELTNMGSRHINLNLVGFTNGIEFTFPSFDLAPGAYCLVVKDIAAFTAKYGENPPVVGQYAGSLSNAGERITLLDAAGTVILDFRFEDNWFDITDGLGFSLTARIPEAADPSNYGRKSMWRPSAHAGGSPGGDDTGQVVPLGSVVINELLANSQGSEPDWVELYNTTPQAIDIGGWFLSDDVNDLTKYRLPTDTRIAGNGYVVLYQDKHFGNTDDPGCKKPFALSRSGETLYLHSGSGGVLTGYSEQETFGASDEGVALGRYRKSTGEYNFVALIEPTPGVANTAPQVGPVAINEIMYHPDAPADAEYVELLNISSESVTLYDAERGLPWRFTDDPENPSIELLFPTSPPVTLVPGEHLLLVKDTGMFDSRYTAPEGVKVLAWGPGRLADDGEKIQLSKPGDPDGRGNPTWVRVDRVVYSDGSHPPELPGGGDPWPARADGQGSSLSRIVPMTYGNDPANWHAAIATPGTVNE